MNIKTFFTKFLIFLIPFVLLSIQFGSEVELDASNGKKAGMLFAPVIWSLIIAGIWHGIQKLIEKNKE